MEYSEGPYLCQGKNLGRLRGLTRLKKVPICCFTINFQGFEFCFSQYPQDISQPCRRHSNGQTTIRAELARGWNQQNWRVNILQNTLGFHNPVYRIEYKNQILLFDHFRH